MAVNNNINEVSLATSIIENQEPVDKNEQRKIDELKKIIEQAQLNPDMDAELLIKAQKLGGLSPAFRKLMEKMVRDEEVVEVIKGQDEFVGNKRTPKLDASQKLTKEIEDLKSIRTILSVEAKPQEEKSGVVSGLVGMFEGLDLKQELITSVPEAPKPQSKSIASIIEGFSPDDLKRVEGIMGDVAGVSKGENLKNDMDRSVRAGKNASKHNLGIG